MNCNILFFWVLCGGAFPPLLTDICEILDQNTNHFTVVLYMMCIFIF